jgi:hypothetical protein
MPMYAIPGTRTVAEGAARSMKGGPGVDDADIEQLVEAQARGELVSPANVPVERTPPSLAELDTRRSKSGLTGGPLLGEVAIDAGGDPQITEMDPTQAGDTGPVEDAQAPPPELGTATLERQDLALAQDLPVPTDADLGLVFRRDPA